MIQDMVKIYTHIKFDKTQSTHMRCSSDRQQIDIIPNINLLGLGAIKKEISMKDMTSMFWVFLN